MVGCSWHDNWIYSSKSYAFWFCCHGMLFSVFDCKWTNWMEDLLSIGSIKNHFFFLNSYLKIPKIYRTHKTAIKYDVNQLQMRVDILFAVKYISLMTLTKCGLTLFRIDRPFLPLSYYFLYSTYSIELSLHSNPKKKLCEIFHPLKGFAKSRRFP